jgi:formylmethanofuran dehydrogenase subunit E
MDKDQLSEELRQLVQFHGHLCPGLLIGYRVSRAAIREGGFEKGKDEEIVARVENDSCAVDAIQYMMGCTFGKGNLAFVDHGKHVYTFWSRKKEKALRISFRENLWERYPEIKHLREKAASTPLSKEEESTINALRTKIEKKLLELPDSELLLIKENTEPPPQKASIHNSIPCDLCGEWTMETRMRLLSGKRLCIPCFAEKERP